jgi:hypothetical protein
VRGVRKGVEENLQVSNDIEHSHGYAECHVLRIVGVHEGWEILGAKFTDKNKAEAHSSAKESDKRVQPWLLNTRIDRALGWIPLEQTKLMHR